MGKKKGKKAKAQQRIQLLKQRQQKGNARRNDDDLQSAVCPHMRLALPAHCRNKVKTPASCADVSFFINKSHIIMFMIFSKKSKFTFFFPISNCYIFSVISL